jgi:hypothetical protein
MSTICNPFTPIPVNPKSHVRGWALHWAETLNAEIATKDTDLSECGTLCVEHGVNFGGSMNLFGGVTDEVMDSIEQLIWHTGKVVSLDITMPNYVDQLSKRKGQATCSKRLTDSVLLALHKKLSSATSIRQSDLKVPMITIGDSHSTAYAEKGASVLRTNGQTLFGVLKSNLIELDLVSVATLPERVCLVFGSIDIRHHIGRQSNPEAALEDLCNAYAKEVFRLSSEHMCDIEVAAPVPVEWEGRKIPKTGFYKDSAFAGTQEQRRLWTELFKSHMKAKGVRVIQPPQEWYEMDGEEYAKKHMELSSSVHISPTNYRRFNWGIK